MNIDHLKFPIGKFEFPVKANHEEISNNIETIRLFPKKLRAAINTLDENQLEKPYRPGGWNRYQVVNHIADSHLSAYLRFKWALTEGNPTIKAYNQDAFANTPDGLNIDLSYSLNLIETMHSKLCFIMENMKPEEWEKSYVHPETGKTFKLYQTLAQYAWHGNHHIAHLQLP